MGGRQNAAPTKVGVGDLCLMGFMGNKKPAGRRVRRLIIFWLARLSDKNRQFL